MTVFGNFFEKNVMFLAIFWHSNGNFLEGQVYTQPSMYQMLWLLVSKYSHMSWKKNFDLFMLKREGRHIDLWFWQDKLVFRRRGIIIYIDYSHDIFDIQLSQMGTKFDITWTFTDQFSVHFGSLILKSQICLIWYQSCLIRAKIDTPV